MREQTVMSISDRLDQRMDEMEDLLPYSDPRPAIDAVRAVLDVCGEVEDQHHPDRMYEGGMEEMAHRVLVAIHKTLGETP